MLTNVLDATLVRQLLENLELKITLDSPSNEYRLEYVTTSTIERQNGEKRLARTYRLFDLARCQVTAEPWDTFDLDKQVTLVTNLMASSGYRITEIKCGWKITCQECGHVMSGYNWESSPKSCTAELPRKCRAKLDDHSVVDVFFAAT